MIQYTKHRMQNIAKLIKYVFGMFTRFFFSWRLGPISFYTFKCFFFMIRNNLTTNLEMYQKYFIFRNKLMPCVFLSIFVLKMETRKVKIEKNIEYSFRNKVNVQFPMNLKNYRYKMLLQDLIFQIQSLECVFFSTTL